MWIANDSLTSILVLPRACSILKREFWKQKSQTMLSIVQPRWQVNLISRLMRAGFRAYPKTHKPTPTIGYRSMAITPADSKRKHAHAAREYGT